MREEGGDVRGCSSSEEWDPPFPSPPLPYECEASSLGRFEEQGLSIVYTYEK